MDMNELWERMSALIRNEMNPINYSAMIQDNLFPAALEDGTLYLRIAMEPLKAYISSNYMPLFMSAAERVSGRPTAVVICTQSELDQRKNPKPARPQSPSVQLNDRYTFDSFVVGANNRFAHAASVAVADNPGKVYNPLFIYGGAGLGKTHLMHAIGHYIQEQHPEMQLVYITSESFTNELISAIQKGKALDFKKRFRNVDVLLVDDIQFIAGRDSTQEEFFNTFNELHGASKQIVLTSDKPPQEIPKLEERLKSRFGGGVTCDIQRPDLETRIAILRKKAQMEGIDVPNDVLELIAVNVDSNIRELEGSLNRLRAYANVVNRPYTEALCREALREVFENKHRRAITPDMILRRVCEFYGVSEADLLSANRRREFVQPRQVAMYLTREMTALSLPQIGAFFGNRDHSTVMHACSVVNSAVGEGGTLSVQITDLREMIKGV